MIDYVFHIKIIFSKLLFISILYNIICFGVFFMAGKSYNHVSLIGNLGKDPEMRTTPTGHSVCSFSLATSERFKGQNGEWQEHTDWHNIVLWDKLGEIANQYLKKGKRVFIEGKIRYRSYEKDGITRYVTDIIGTNMVMLDGGREQGEYSQDRPARDTGNGYSSIESHLPPEINAIDDEVPF